MGWSNFIWRIWNNPFMDINTWNNRSRRSCSNQYYIYEGTDIERKKILTYEHLKKERIISSDGSTKINIIGRTKTIKEKGVEIKHREYTVKEKRHRYHPFETPGEKAATIIGHFLTFGISTVGVAIASSIYDDYWVKYEWDDYIGPDGELIKSTPRRETNLWKA